MPVIFELPAEARFPSAWSPRQLAEWQAIGRGPVASNLAECGLFAGEPPRSTPVARDADHYLRHPSDAAPAAMTIGVTVSDLEAADRSGSNRLIRGTPRGSTRHT